MPSIVCLVEVRPEPLKLLMELPWVRDKYVLSTTTIAIGGALMLVSRTLPWPTFEHHTWPTNMPRIFLTARFGAGPSQLMVGCVHLESMASQPTREGQLRVCSQVLRSSPRALLMGDFNISERKEENGAIERMLGGFVDVWPALHRGSPGYSRDTKTNTMLKGATLKRFRIDRVLCKPSLVPKTIKLVGNSEFAKLTDERGELCSVFISDHFGLFATFELP